MGTYGNLLNLKKHEIFDFKKTSYGRRRKKERRTKQSLDSPQMIEANKKIYIRLLEDLDWTYILGIFMMYGKLNYSERMSGILLNF